MPQRIKILPDEKNAVKIEHYF